MIDVHATGREPLKLRLVRLSGMTALLAATVLAGNAPAFSAGNPHSPSNPIAVMTTSMGTVRIELFPKLAPKTVANFIGLSGGTKAWTDPRTGKTVRRPFYNGLTFHRVIPDFMIQGGDPLGSGMGGPGYQFANETSPDVTFDRPGRLAMANAGPDTNGSQFFITTAAYPSLNGGYSLFGQVVSGQNVVDEISKVARDPQDKPIRPVLIKQITILNGGSAAHVKSSAPSRRHK